MDPTNNVTYKLISDLFREVQERFPDKYFHVGGDEVEMDCWWGPYNLILYNKESYNVMYDLNIDCTKLNMLEV